MFRCINSAATPPAQQHVKVDHTPPLVPTTMGSGAGNKVQVKACNQLRMVKAMQQERSRSILERNAAVFRKQQPESKKNKKFARFHNTGSCKLLQSHTRTCILL